MDKQLHEEKECEQRKCSSKNAELVWLVRTTTGYFTLLLVNLANLRDLFGVEAKLKGSIFDKKNQINSTVVTRTWVLSISMDQDVTKYRMVSE